MKSSNPTLQRLEKTLEALRSEERFRTLRGITPDSGRFCRVQGQTLIDFASNDYLGLARHPLVIESAQDWSARYGAGCRASRLVDGTLPAVLELEAEIARWKGTEAALILGSGYMANVGILRALSTKNTVFLADKLNHASLNLGCQNPPAEFKRYRHNDMTHLRSLLSVFPQDAEKIIVSDTVFSMDGDLAPLDELRSLANEFNALLYLDDAHGGGIIGTKGKGLSGSVSPAEIAMGTCSKAFGSYGAYVACSTQMRDILINTCGSFIFSTALPPAVYGAISGALSVIRSAEGDRRRQTLAERSEQLRSGLRNLGFNTGTVPSVSTPIIPLILGENSVALQASDTLRNAGFLTVAIRPPTVPLHSARLRLTLCSDHTSEMIEAFLMACASLR